MEMYLFYFLAEILTGGVKVIRNPLLCNVETIQWSDIVDKTRNPVMQVEMETVPQRCMKSISDVLFFCF